LPYIDFYNREHPRPHLRYELALLDAEGRVRWEPRWRGLLLQPGIGNGLLADWQTLVTVWEAFRYMLDTLAPAYGAYEAKKLWDKLRDRSKGAPEVVSSHYRDWQENGARPDNVDELLGQRPWQREEFAQRFGCTPKEAEAFLLGAGYAQGRVGSTGVGRTRRPSFYTATLNCRSRSA